MLFSSSRKNKKIMKDTFSSIEKRVNNMDFELAKEYLSWLDKKTFYLEKTIQKSSYGIQPDHLKRGDIIWVEFGINVGTELSDYKTKGHYALAIYVSLGNVVVIPLSSRKSEGSLYLDIGIIPELNEIGESNHSYLKLDAIRSVSKRRIGRINGIKSGKIELEKERFDDIKKQIEIAFFD